MFHHIISAYAVPCERLKEIIKQIIPEMVVLFSAL